MKESRYKRAGIFVKPEVKQKIKKIADSNNRSVPKQVEHWAETEDTKILN